MSDPRWIVIRNWDRFQHPDVTRSGKAPPWIRNYTELLHDPSYLGLTLHQRGVLHGLWMEYATARRQLPDSTSTVSRRLGERVTRQTLDALNHAGFIEFSASKPQAERKQPASLEERRGEKKPPNPPSGSNRNGRQRKPTPEEVPALIDVVTACQMFIEGQAWDDSFDNTAMLEEFRRIERGRRTEGTLNNHELNGLIEQWLATRQDRYGIKANLGATP